jgi:hypothetical protein
MLPLVSSWEFIPAVIHKARLQMRSIDAVCGILHLLGVGVGVGVGVVALQRPLQLCVPWVGYHVRRGKPR